MASGLGGGGEGRGGGEGLYSQLTIAGRVRLTPCQGPVILSM